MKRTSLAVPLLVVAAAACKSSDSEPAAPTEAVGALEGAAAPPTGDVLALGDSITYGWDPNLQPEGPPTSRYKSYADELGMSVVNGACSGETSASFLDAKAPDAGCHGNEGFMRWLKTPWNADTQVEFATNYLRAAASAGRPPKVVVMTLGGNDIFLYLDDCSAITCGTHLPGAVSGYRENLTAVFQKIAATGYKGKVVVPSIYALDYSSTIQTFGIGQFNKALEAAVDAVNEQHRDGPEFVVADAFGAWQEASGRGSACKAGLLLPSAEGREDGDEEDGKNDNADDDDDKRANSPKNANAKNGDDDDDDSDDGDACDVHPSEKGRKLIAQKVKEALQR